MSKLYVVVKVLPYMKLDPKRNVIGTFFDTSVPFVFDSYEPANKEAKKLHKMGINAYVCEFNSNPLDDLVKAMGAEIARIEGILRGDVE